MGEAYDLAALMAVFACIGWFAIVKLYPHRAQPMNKGTWRRVQETVNGRDSTTVRIILVREHEGRETGRLVIREIDSSAANWNDAYTDAIAEADQRLAALESAEQH